MVWLVRLCSARIDEYGAIGTSPVCLAMTRPLFSCIISLFVELLYLNFNYILLYVINTNNTAK